MDEGIDMDIDPPDLRSLSLGEGDDPEDAEASDSPTQDNGADLSVRENDRVYANDSYLYPDDQDEETRQSILHQAFTLFLDRKLVMASIPPSMPLKILDIGTGGGDWALAAATQFTSSSIIATDLSPNVGSATSGDIPANLEFQIDDARIIPWTFDSEAFDIIHIRGLGGAFSESEMTAVYNEAHRCLKIGGYLEVGDFGAVTLSSGTQSHTGSPEESSTLMSYPPSQMPLNGQSYLAIYNAAVDSAAATRGLLGANDVKHMTRPLIESAGFRVQRHVRPNVPLGEWSSDPRDHRVGRMINVAMLEGFEAKALRLLTRDLGWQPTDVRDLCERVKMEVLAPGGRPSAQCHYIVARKLLV